MENNTPLSQQEALNFARMLRLANKSIPEIQDLLVQKGLSPLDAQLIAGQAEELNNAVQDNDIRERNKAANRKIIIGLLFCIGGLIVTFVTMNSGNGGIIAWGAILFGFIDIIIGASQRVSA